VLAAGVFSGIARLGGNYVNFPINLYFGSCFFVFLFILLKVNLFSVL